MAVLFSDRKFILLHRKKTLISSKNYSLLVDQQYTTTIFNFTYMEKPIKVFSSKRYFMVGVCNGIACFTYSHFGNDMILYNSAVKLNELIDFKRGKDYSRFPLPRAVIGFGSGLKEDEFIIIRISSKMVAMHLQPDEEQAEVHVYSTASDAWKKIKMDNKFRVGGDCVLVQKGIPYCFSSIEISEGGREEIVPVLL